jgi:dihydrofolate reductase
MIFPGFLSLTGKERITDIRILLQPLVTTLLEGKTYDKVKQMVGNFPPAKDFNCYVLSRTRTGKQDGVFFHNGNVAELIAKLKQTAQRNIYCDGGGEIVKLLMEHKLIDEFIISIIPVILGDGKRLFLRIHAAKISRSLR